MEEVVAKGEIAAAIAALVVAVDSSAVKAVAIELLTVAVVGKVETVVWRLVRSLWFALSASPFVTDDVVARVAVAAEMAVPRAEVGSYDDMAVAMRLLTPVVLGRAATVVCRAVMSLLLAREDVAAAMDVATWVLWAKGTRAAVTSAVEASPATDDRGA
jgi:hypothetical protein